MRRIKCLMCSLLGILTITSCGNNKVEHSSSNTDNQQPAKISWINFDGKFVQTYSCSSWPIAFDSYRIENNYLIIEGKAYCWGYRGYDELYNVDDLEHYFNDREGTFLEPYYVYDIMSDDPLPDWMEDGVYPNFRWEIKDLPGDFLFYFSINIDLSTFIENDATIGYIYLGYDFIVMHYFKGGPTW